MVEQNFLLSSYHAVFGLRHRDKSAKVIGLSGQTRGERDSTTDVFLPQTFTMADANVYGKKHILLGNQILSGQYLFPEASYSSRERPWGGEDLTPALLGLKIYHASNGPLTNGTEDRGLIYLHATFLTGTIDTL